MDRTTCDLLHSRRRGAALFRLAALALLPACAGGVLAKSDDGATAKNDAGVSPTPDAGVTTSHDAGVAVKHDGRVSDARVRDVSATIGYDATDVPFWQWWDPQCGVPGSPCTKRKCTTVEIQASPVGGCSFTVDLMTGCLLIDNTATMGWTSYVSSDRQIIQTLVFPYTMAGLSLCGYAAQGYVGYPYDTACCPWFDAGSDAAGASDGAADASGSVDAVVGQ